MDSNGTIKNPIDLLLEEYDDSNPTNRPQPEAFTEGPATNQASLQQAFPDSQVSMGQHMGCDDFMDVPGESHINGSYQQPVLHFESQLEIQGSSAGNEGGLLTWFPTSLLLNVNIQEVEEVLSMLSRAPNEAKELDSTNDFLEVVEDIQEQELGRNSISAGEQLVLATQESQSSPTSMEINLDSEPAAGHGEYTGFDDIFGDISDIDFGESSGDGPAPSSEDITNLPTSVSGPSQRRSGRLATKMVVCPDCRVKFKNAAGLKSHQRTKHVPGNLKHFICKFCQKVYKYKKCLETHEERAHKPSEDITDSNDADVIADERSKFRTVMKSGHNHGTAVNENSRPMRVAKKAKLKLRSQLLEKGNERSLETVRKKGHERAAGVNKKKVTKPQCSRCSKTLSTATSLKKHLIGIHELPAGERLHSCRLCNVRYRWKVGLYNHSRLKHSGAPTLKMCGYYEHGGNGLRCIL